MPTHPIIAKPKASLTNPAPSHRCPDAPRNVDDEILVALAAKGGVIGASADNQVIAPAADEPGATMDQFIDQIDYMVILAATA